LYLIITKYFKQLIYEKEVTARQKPGRNQEKPVLLSIPELIFS